MSIAATTEEWLKKTAAESVRHSENLRGAVRDMTLKALEGRELTLARIQEVLRSVTQGINLGTEGARGRTDKVFADALAGMDDALLKAAKASHIAVSRLSEDGDFDHSELKRALDELERWEDAFFGAVREASSGAGEKIREQWGALLAKARVTGSGAGAEAAATLEDYGKRVRDAMRESRVAAAKTAHQMTQNFAILASGILIGLSEGLHGSPEPAGKPPQKPPEKKPARAAKAAPARKKAAKRVRR
jgi:hypothetical protein